MSIGRQGNGIPLSQVVQVGGSTSGAGNAVADRGAATDAATAARRSANEADKAAADARASAQSAQQSQILAGAAETATEAAALRGEDAAARAEMDANEAMIDAQRAANSAAEAAQVLVDAVKYPELAAPAGAELVGFEQAAVGATRRSVQAKLSDTVDIIDFGASFAPGFDNRAAIQAALNAGGNSSRPGRREVIIRGNNIIQVGGQLNVPDNVRLVFDGESRLVPIVGGLGILNSRGALPTSTVALTADSPRGSVTVSVGASASMFAVGDYVWVSDDKVIDTSPNSNNLTQAQMARVSGIESGILYLDRIIQYDFTVASNARVGVMECRRGIVLENVKIGQEGAPRARRGVDFRWQDGLRISDFDFSFNRRSYSVTPEFSDVNENALAIKHCSDVVLERISGTNLAFYLIEVDGACHNVVARDITMRRGRHAFSTNWNGPGEPIDVLVENLTSEVSQLGGFDTHDVGRGITARNIRCSQSLADGLQIRTSNVLVEDYVGEFNATNGLVVRTEVQSAQPKLNNVVLRNIVCRDNGGRGIFSQVPIDLDGFKVERNGNGTALNDSGGVVAPAGSIRNGTVLDTLGAAIFYQPFNVEASLFGPLLIDNVVAPASARQTRFVYSSVSFNEKGLQVRESRATGYTTGNLFSRNGSTAVTDIDERGNTWGSGPKSGVVIMAAGTFTVSTDQVRALSPITSGTFRSKVTLRNLQNGGTPGVLACAITDATSFTVMSSSNTDTSRVEWTIE